jgi:hypothetical protein
MFVVTFIEGQGGSRWDEEESEPVLGDRVGSTESKGGRRENKDAGKVNSSKTQGGKDETIETFMVHLAGSNGRGPLASECVWNASADCSTY